MTTMARPRWHDYVIVISIILIGVAGSLAIWGDDLVALVRDVSRGSEPAGPTTEQPVPPAPPVELPPGGTPI